MTAYQKEYGPKGDQEQGGKTRYIKICKTKLEEEDTTDKERWQQRLACLNTCLGTTRHENKYEKVNF